MKETEKEEMKTMLEDDITECAFVNPIIGIEKKTGKMCLCLDATESTSKLMTGLHQKRWKSY